MTLVREIGMAVCIVIATLWLQSVGLAALILWIRRAVANDLQRLGPLLSAVLVVRLTAAIIALHGVLILFWASCYRRLCFSSWDSALYFSASSYSVPEATPARLAIFAVAATSPTLAISSTAARRIALRFLGLLARAILWISLQWFALVSHGGPSCFADHGARKARPKILQINWNVRSIRFGGGLDTC
jgi:hypothetical protein